MQFNRPKNLQWGLYYAWYSRSSGSSKRSRRLKSIGWLYRAQERLGALGSKLPNIGRLTLRLKWPSRPLPFSRLVFNRYGLHGFSSMSLFAWFWSYRIELVCILSHRVWTSDPIQLYIYSQVDLSTFTYIALQLTAFIFDWIDLEWVSSI